MDEKLLGENALNQTFSNNESSVLIIGFGISGIVQTHTLVSNGFTDITVVDAQKSFGGVWNMSLHYPGLCANNSKNTFQLPELPQEPGEFDDFATQEQINGYLKRYVTKFDLEQYVQYGTRVKSLERRSDSSTGNWLFDVTFDKKVNGAIRSTFDMVICATGYTCDPLVPAAIQTAPKGVTVLHSSEIRKALAKNPNLVQGKRVAVIGTSKSGQDAALWAAEADSLTVDMIGPEFNWSVPRYFEEDREKGLAGNEVIYSGLMSYLLPSNPATFKERNGWFGVKLLFLYFLHKTPVGSALRDFIWASKLAELVKMVGIPTLALPSLRLRRFRRPMQLVRALRRVCCEVRPQRSGHRVS